MSRHKIAVIPGDNVGPEVVGEGVKVVSSAARICGATIELTEFPWGTDYYLANGDPMPKDGLEILADYDAIYLGAMGDPARVPNTVLIWGLLQKIKKGMDQYVNLRPTRLLPGVPCPLKEPGNVDFAIVRENTEGEYSGAGGRLHVDTENEVAVQVSVFTRAGSERVMRYAFELARARDGQRRVTCVTKAGAMNHSMSFWDDVFKRVSAGYPDVQAECVNVDAMSMYLITRPSHYDVVVTTNQYGDILSDEASAIQGSIGMAPAGSIDPERKHPSLFEPIHGSAPDIAGRGIANPIGTIMAGKMMLDYLGEREAANLIARAVEAVMAEGGVRTQDIGGRSSTREVGDAVREKLEGLK